MMIFFSLKMRFWLLRVYVHVQMYVISNIEYIILEQLVIAKVENFVKCE